MTIRTLKKADLPTIMAIEQSIHLTPWTRDTFLMCFESQYAGWVAEADDKIIGFIIASIHSDECHILNVCILREYQHQGYGLKLMDQALTHAKKQGAGIAYLEVRKSNTKAIALYRKMKFLQVGERKEYYPSANGNEDALIFAKSLITEIS